MKKKIKKINFRFKCRKNRKNNRGKEKLLTKITPQPRTEIVSLEEFKVADEPILSFPCLPALMDRTQRPVAKETCVWQQKPSIGT